MTTFREQDWPAHEPPADFAVRTVDAMLAPAKPMGKVRPLRQPRKVMLFWVFAALFASGSALAWTWSRHHRVHAPVARVLEAPALAAPVSSSIARVMAAVSSVAPPSIASTSRPKVHAVRPATKTEPQTPQAPPQPRTPACQCERGFSDFMCDCY
jgi:hypothetical protein